MLTKTKKPFLVTLVVLLGSLFFLMMYLGTTLRGDINYFMLPGAYFKIPVIEQQHHIEHLYHNPTQTGWDGQFYYATSNDLFGLKDTPKLMDASSYRYQRIGLSLTAKAVSLVAFQSWVAPLTYYSTNLVIILIAVFVFAYFLQEYQLSAWFAVLWGLGYGVQITLSNALPDGAAQAYFILAMFSFTKRKYWWYAIFATLSALCREEFILAFVVIGAFELGEDLFRNRLNFKAYQPLTKYCLLALPGVIWLSWQIYITKHFNATPASQASTVGYPMVNYFILLHDRAYTFFCGEATRHRSEFFGLLLFFLLLITAFFREWKVIKNWSITNKAVAKISLALLPILILYLFFDNTVLGDKTGYYKVSGIFFILLPLTYMALSQAISFYTKLLLWVSFICGLIFLWSRNAIEPSVDLLSDYPTLASQNYPCVRSLPHRIEILKVENFYHYPIFRKLIFRNPMYIYQIKLTNLSNKTWYSSHGFGSVDISYQYLNNEGYIIKSGIKTPLSKTLKPGESLEQQVLVVGRQTHSAKATIKLIVQQRGCNIQQ